MTFTNQAEPRITDSRKTRIRNQTDLGTLLNRLNQISGFHPLIFLPVRYHFDGEGEMSEQLASHTGIFASYQRTRLNASLTRIEDRSNCQWRVGVEGHSELQIHVTFGENAFSSTTKSFSIKSTGQTVLPTCGRVCGIRSSSGDAVKHPEKPSVRVIKHRINSGLHKISESLPLLEL